MNKQKAVKKILAQNHADAMLLTSEVNMHYFCGFSPSEGMVFLTETAGYHIVDSRYTEIAQRHAKKTGLHVIEISTNFIDTVNDLLKKHAASSILIENETISLAQYRRFSKTLNAKLVDMGSAIEALRNVKTEEELAKIEKAQGIAEKAYTELLNDIKPGKTEKELCALFDYLMAKYGSDGVSFDTILLSGPNTSMPHGVPSERKLKSGEFVLMDFGATFEGYHSDTTRTVCLGQPNEEMQRVYNAVLKAQQAGIEALSPGAKCSDVYAQAYQVLEQYGYAPYFRHSLGHGVGLQIHEGYNASPRSTDVFVPGNVTSIEPGVYLPGKFGVRTEDLLAVTENGTKDFTTLNKELVIL